MISPTPKLVIQGTQVRRERWGAPRARGLAPGADVPWGRVAAACCGHVGAAEAPRVLRRRSSEQASARLILVFHICSFSAFTLHLLL